MGCHSPRAQREYRRYLLDQCCAVRGWHQAAPVAGRPIEARPRISAPEKTPQSKSSLGSNNVSYGDQVDHSPAQHEVERRGLQKRMFGGQPRKLRVGVFIEQCTKAEADCQYISDSIAHVL